ncbi:hypothetical protein [Acinetobacter silvestris]|uniref:Uncharacterized protein n=1 Tax=Acinetobacter silvestris TaxID=1977882 RepID=A0A1Y3CH07_9GAMM|nr:hypothetical protein [Acinetobacter silvestris]OTG66416.1 hypothetical protein B9T28_03940 [Acinetobacter silvestris]
MFQLENLHKTQLALHVNLGLNQQLIESILCIAFGYSVLQDLIEDFQDGLMDDASDPSYNEELNQICDMGVVRKIDDLLRQFGIFNPNLAHQVISLIYSHFVPNCSYCGREHHSVMNFVRPVAYHDGYTQFQYWVCDSCVTQSRREMNVGIGFCWCCGDQPHDIRDLNNQNECPIHYGESSYSEEELEDMESYIEYHTKDS